MYCLVIFRPGHNSDIKTNYKSAYVGALEPIMGSLAEPVGDASSSSTVAVSSGVSLYFPLWSIYIVCCKDRLKGYSHGSLLTRGDLISPIKLIR